MQQLSAGILMVFALWVAWRLITRQMRRTLILVDTGPGTQKRVMSQYNFILTIARTLWHNFKARPRDMLTAILNVLRRPRV